SSVRCRLQHSLGSSGNAARQADEPNRALLFVVEVLKSWMSDRNSVRFCYSDSSPLALLASATFLFALVVGGFWVLLAKDAHLYAELLLFGAMVPVAGLSSQANLRVRPSRPDGDQLARRRR